MNHVSSIRAGCLLGGLSLVSLSLTGGCLRDVGLDGGGESTGSGFISGVGGGGPVVGVSSSSGGPDAGHSTGVSSSSGVGGGFGVSSSSGGTGGVFGVSSSSGGLDAGLTMGVGGGFGVSSSSGGTGGGSFGVSSSSGGIDAGVSMSASSSSSGGPAPSCQLGSAPVSCDFANLNADCAAYGAVCDFLYGQCSCCFVHDESTCTTDADCEVSFGANSFCSAGTCGCK